jgi:AcrR family transcriptional regulator
MTDIDRKRMTAPKPDTKAALLAAAAAEFNSRGFGGTDTNRIARAAGFAPQTFYRHFADKTEIFIQVYERWQTDERERIARAVRQTVDTRARALAVAAAMIDAHREWAGFRRSLRLLAVEEPRVRAARAASRRAQLESLSWRAEAGRWPERVAALLTIERLCDAAADHEIEDLEVEAAAWVERVAGAIDTLRGLSAASA